MDGPVRREWFAKLPRDEGLQQTLNDLKGIKTSHSSFRDRVLKLFGTKTGLKPSSTKRELEDELLPLTTSEIAEMVSNRLSSVAEQRENYVQDRNSGVKKVGQRLQNFFNVLAEFIGAFSGIVTLVEKAGAPYGQVAYEALSLLLFVFRNKSQNDFAISECLKDLTTAFPQLETLRDIYPSALLEANVTAVYIRTILFIRKAAEYFARFSVRFVSALTKAPTLGIDEAINSIKSRLVLVNKEAMVQLHKRNKDILDIAQRLEEASRQQSHEFTKLQQSNRELENQNKGLIEKLEQLVLLNELIKKDAEERDKSNDQERLDRLRYALGFKDEPISWPETNVSTLYGSLCETFPGCILQKASPRRAMSLNFHDMTCEKIFSDKLFQDWVQSSGSRIFFACGNTVLESRARRQARHSWLSPGAVYAAAKFCLASQEINGQVQKRLQNCAPDLVAGPKETDLHLFYTCQPQPWGQQPFHYDTLQLFGFLAWSISRWHKPEILRHIEHIQAQAQYARELADSAELSKKKKYIRMSSLTLLTDLIINMLEHVQDEDQTVWLIIDRLDQCDLPISKIMNEFVRIVESVKVRFKLLCINEASFNGSTWDCEDVDKVIYRDDWNQTRLRTFEQN